MGNEEMLSTFDVLYNNITSNQAPGLNIYEISLLLTRAENEIVKNYFTPKGNRYQEGYDGSPKRQSDFAVLVDTYASTEEKSLNDKLDVRSHVFGIPKDVFLILNEEIRELNADGEYGSVYTVVPLAFEEYSRLMQKPYKWPLKDQFWRLVTGKNDEDVPLAELVGRSGSKTLEYFLRYVRRPKPIILGNLAEIDSSLKIEGKSNAQECELPEHLHMEIVQRAVELAKLIWAGDINATIEAGQRSE